MTQPSRPRSPLWLVVLSLACEEPMHPYRMQTLIKERGKDLVANVAQRNSVYQTIDALRRAGLIKVREMEREERRPERTIYEATAEGRRTLRSWLTTALSTPAREFPELPAALSVLDPSLTPDELGQLLQTRVAALEVRLDALEKPVPGLPRIFLLESEYLAAVTRAEIKWLVGVITDLRTGRLAHPSAEEMRRIAAAMSRPGDDGSDRVEPRAAAAGRAKKRRARRSGARRR
jgi:DNA-binding PadR family transcriptional regulator